jgi:hypothetical protein
MQTASDLWFTVEQGSAAVLGAADGESYLLRVLLTGPFLLPVTLGEIEIRDNECAI